MFFQNSDLKFIDINIDDGDDAKSVNSIEEEISQASLIDSDLQEFNKMEQEIYGNDFEEGEEDDDNEEIDDDDDDDNTLDNGDLIDETSESLQLVRPKIDKKPRLGDAILVYDQLQSRYPRSIQEKVFTTNNQINQSEIMKSPARSIGSSRNSAETVLSQEDDEIEIKTPISQQRTPKNPSPMYYGSHSSSKENIQDDRFHEKLQSRLAKEQEIREQHEKHIEQLYESINKLQTRHAIAEETIDQLRLGVDKPGGATRLNYISDASKLRGVNLRRGPDAARLRNKRRSIAVDRINSSGFIDDDETRRYSSITGSVDFMKNFGEDLGNRQIGETRARSVDMDMLEHDEASQRSFSPTKTPNASPIMKHHLGKNHLQKLADRFQTRAQILEEEIQNLNLNLDSQYSSETGSSSYSPSILPNKPRKKLSKLRLNQFKERIANAQSAYDNLQSEFESSKNRWKSSDPDQMNMQPFSEFKDQLESQLFSLSMQLDALELKLKESDEAPIRNYPIKSVDNKKPNNQHRNRALEVEGRISDLENQYDQLISHYTQLKQQNNGNNSRLSPSVQSEIDDLIEQLRLVVFEANGRSPHIVSPHRLTDILDQSDQSALLPLELSGLAIGGSPVRSQQQPIQTTSEDDRLSSATSSFRRGKWQQLSNKPIEDLERGSNGSDPTSQRRPSQLLLRRQSSVSPHDHKPASLPQSAISSGTTASMWRGATSGETLPVDEHGVIQLKEPLHASTPRSSENGSLKLKFKKPRSFQTRNSSSLHNSLDEEESNKMRLNGSINLNQNLEDDIRSLDQQLAMAQLEEQAATIIDSSGQKPSSRINRHTNSVLSGSRHTRSLLGTSPSNTPSNASRSSHVTGDDDYKGSGHSYRSSGKGSSHTNGNEISSPNQTRRSVKSSSKPPIHKSSSPITSDCYSADEDDSISDLEEYVSQATAGKGNRSRYVRTKNRNLVDRWCQTPSQHNKSSNQPHRWNGLTEAPYEDYVDYWDGDSFHPERQGLPGKSILRPPSHGGSFKKSKNGYHTRPPITDPDYMKEKRRKRDYPDDINDRRMTWARQSDPSAIRHYSMIEPHRYFVREYTQNPNPFIPNRYNNSNYDGNGEIPGYYYDNESDDDYENYQQYIENRRLNRYLDDALQEASKVHHRSQNLATEMMHQYHDRFIDYRPVIDTPRSHPPPPPPHRRSYPHYPIQHPPPPPPSSYYPYTGNMLPSRNTYHPHPQPTRYH